MTRTIQEFVLIDVDEQYCPPESVLVVGMVDDLLHFEIAKYSEDGKTRTTEKIASMCVDARSFYDLFVSIWKDEHRPPVMLGSTPMEPMHGERTGPAPKRGSSKQKQQETPDDQ